MRAEAGRSTGVGVSAAVPTVRRRPDSVATVTVSGSTPMGGTDCGHCRDADGLKHSAVNERAERARELSRASASSNRRRKSASSSRPFRLSGFARGFALVLVAAPSVSAANSLAAFFDKSTGGVDVRTRTEATRMNARRYVHRLRVGRSINAMSAVAARKSGRRVSHSPFEWVTRERSVFLGEGHA